jgi:hypothetical protein
VLVSDPSCVAVRLSKVAVASAPTCVEVKAPSCPVLKPCSSVEVNVLIWLAVSEATCDVVNASAYVVVRLLIVVADRP